MKTRNEHARDMFAIFDVFAAKPDQGGEQTSLESRDLGLLA